MRVTFPVLGLVAGLALLSCTDKPKAAAPPPAKLGPIETPEDLLGTLLVRDVGVLTETGNAGLLGSGQPPRPTCARRPGVGEAVSDLDLHAPLAVVVLGDLRKSQSWHFVAAGKLQHAQKTREKLASQQKGTDSAATGTTVFAADKGAITVLGDYLVFGDTSTALDAAGRFTAREAADGTPPHDLVLHVSLGKFAGALRKDAEQSWKEKGKDPDLGWIEPLERILVEAIGDLGDVDAWTDQAEENWSMEVRVGATGKLSDLLAAYPSAPVTSMMSLPKASSAGSIRFPDAMAKAWRALIAQSKSAWGSFVRSMGNEIAFSFAEKGAKPGDPFREISCASSSPIRRPARPLSSSCSVRRSATSPTARWRARRGASKAPNSGVLHPTPERREARSPLGHQGAAPLSRLRAHRQDDLARRGGRPEQQGVVPQRPAQQGLRGEAPEAGARRGLLRRDRQGAEGERARCGGHARGRAPRRAGGRQGGHHRDLHRACLRPHGARVVVERASHAFGERRAARIRSPERQAEEALKGCRRGRTTHASAAERAP